MLTIQSFMLTIENPVHTMIKWLQVGVVPVFKKGSTTDLANYRPVSLTSVLFKILEKIVANCFIDRLNKNQLTISMALHQRRV